MLDLPTNLLALTAFSQTFNNRKFFSKFNYKFLNKSWSKNIVHLLQKMKHLHNCCIKLYNWWHGFQFLIRPVLLMNQISYILYFANVQQSIHLIRLLRCLEYCTIHMQKHLHISTGNSLRMCEILMPYTGNKII